MAGRHGMGSVAAALWSSLGERGKKMAHLSSWRRVGLVVGVLLLALVVPSAMRSSKALAQSCPTVLEGLHGVNEGPSDLGDPNQSPEIESTFHYFQQWALAHSKAEWVTSEVPYTTITMQDVASLVWSAVNQTPDPAEIEKVVNNVNEGSTNLEDDMQENLQACPSTKFDLVGYSEGAWVIDAWLASHQSEAASNVKAIALYGDPNWYRSANKTEYQGLARLAGQSGSYNPYPAAPDSPFGWKGWCIGGDPVCGEGFANTWQDHYNQWAAAIACAVKSCVHNQYAPSATKPGGEFLASVSL